jgi:hypothetical protein
MPPMTPPANEPDLEDVLKQLSPTLYALIPPGIGSLMILQRGNEVIIETTLPHGEAVTLLGTAAEKLRGDRRSAATWKLSKDS